tara:strand:- start:3887 stop:4456 length:570 start_codon:yes stop_codon:yes gene_type:complete
VIKLILASSSIYRREILSRHYSDYKCISPDVDETPLKNENPISLAKRLSSSKAERISKEFPDHFVIGSDQVASFEGNILGKPGSYKKALDNFKLFRGKSVLFHAGGSIRNESLAIENEGLETTEIKFKDYSDQDMTSYLDSLDTFNTTAGVKSESMLFSTLVDEIIADDEYAIMGLPINWILDQLSEFS